MSIEIYSAQQLFDTLNKTRRPHHQDYLSMYSSWYGCIITDPTLMLIPIDDHMVHRGDGIFEAFKCINGYIYQLDFHFKRMENSLKHISLQLPFSIQQIKKIIIDTIRAGGEKDCIIRVYISRGPGDFSPKPEKSIAPQLYVVVTRIKEVEEKKRTKGCSLKISKVPIKDPFFAKIKSCNYLPNVLMKMECHKYGVDYVVGVDENCRICEGATENFAVITQNNEFLTPYFENILKGSTVCRALDMARDLVKEKRLQGARMGNVYIKDLFDAKEILVFGTTIDVLPITSFEGKSIGNGRPGEFYHIFYEKFLKDIKENKDLLTPVWS